MAGKTKKRVDRNASLTPFQILNKRIIRETIWYWLFVFVAFFAATVAVIQAGPFHLTLEVLPNSSSEHDEILTYAGAILGGFSILWMAVASAFAAFYYRMMIAERGPSVAAAKTALPIAAAAA